MKLDKVASKDQARPVLTGCGFRMIDGELHACVSDSYCLVAVPIKGGSDDWEGAIIPAAALKAWQGKLTGMRPTLALDCRQDNGQTVGEAIVTIPGEGETRFSLLPGTYPKVGELFPDDSLYEGEWQGSMEIGLNPQLLINVSQALGNPSGMKARGIKIEAGSNTRPFRISVLGKKGVTARALLMPIKIAN
jgi:DNA polymerase III sliding clamp (beta) subunit (PCNA family)